jgi:colanic acid/amylovoran biosynthesis glycosyltransferase
MKMAVADAPRPIASGRRSGESLHPQGLRHTRALSSAPGIAYMTGEYFRLSPFVFIQREVESLRALGFRVDVFSIRGLADPKEAVLASQREEAERAFVVLPTPPLRLIKAHLTFLAARPRWYVRAVRLAWQTRPPGLRAALRQAAYFAEAAVVAAEVRRRGLAHLHNHLSGSSGTVAMLAAELGGFSFSLSEHGPDIFFQPTWWRLDEKFRRASFVRCISDFCRSQAMIFAPPECWDRLHVIHCGVDPGQFGMRDHSGQGRRLLFVGRLSAVKGVLVLLHAMARLRRRFTDVVLTLVGDGPDRGRIERTVEALELKEHVALLGYRSTEEVRELLVHADVFVLPSFAEGVPVVLMEAMASGVPVVASRIAGIPELVEDGVSGVLVPPANSDALARAITRLLEDPSLRRRLAERGRAVVEREFDIRREVAKMACLFEQTLRTGQDGPWAK